MDISTLNAAQRYVASRPATSPQENVDPGTLFRDVMQETVASVQRGEQASLNSMAGGADPHALVHALSQAELAVETAVTIRDRVVEAYQEILRMPV
ncbi:flagellar hook-basal body complex protein FliE [Cognatishimia sp. WU-CL00825]|uniref:flagellar hook-basal body complex protein FliE n=1 Tax=Cognatishimia sp. WU-CL00825 TaxID=3127658 RepID=UPI0031029AD4